MTPCCLRATTVEMQQHGLQFLLRLNLSMESGKKKSNLNTPGYLVNTDQYVMYVKMGAMRSLSV